MENNLNIHTGPRAVKFFIDKHINKDLEQLGITSAYGPFIMTIDDTPGASLKDISFLLSVDKALTTRMVKHLIEEDFAENISDDPRKYRMVLTEKGKNAAVVIRERLNSIWNILLKDFTQEDKDNFADYISRIRKVIDSYDTEEQ